MGKMSIEIREEVLKWPNSTYDRGKKEGIEQVARKLLQKGMNHAEISELTGLSEAEIKSMTITG